MNKYEKLIEYIVNDEQDKARALFHDIVVEKSRGIYESLMDDERGPGGDAVEDMVDEISHDEEGMHEADDDMDLDGEDEIGTDMDDMDDMGDDHHADVGGEEGLEDRVMDLESALDELKAEFDALMSDEAGEEDHGDMDFDAEGGDEEDMKMMEAEEEEEEEEDEEAVEESRQNMSSAEKIREYVEKVSGGADKTEGGEVAKGGSVSVNKQSIVAGKNDMGGTSANIVKGGSEQSPDNKPVPKASNAYTKGQGQLKGAGSYENVPGAKTKGYTSKQSAKKGEDGGTNKTSIESGKK
jgi:hypothetical protein